MANSDGLSSVQDNGIGTVVLSANTSWYLFNFRSATIRRLVAEDFRVVCLSPQDEYSDRLLELGAEWCPLSMDSAGSNPFKDFVVFARFLRQYRRLQPVAALHYTIKNNIYGTWAACAAGVPAINNVSGLGTAFVRRGVVASLARLMYRLSQPMASRVFCQNPDDRDLLLRKHIVPPERLACLPGSGVDLRRFNPGLRKHRSGPFRFLYAGRMLSDKGLHELVGAMRSLYEEGAQATLWLCGFPGVSSVSAVDACQLEIWGQEPYIEWMGPTDVIEEVLAQVDCVVLPSYYGEGVPRSLLEAGAMGLPIITTDTPGCRHAVEDGVNGFLCQPRSIDSLAGTMRRMIALSEGERCALGERGRQRVEKHFNEDFVVEATLVAVRGCLGA
jgi:glycosyltransferase involved in cell wall biosynthesis